MGNRNSAASFQQQDESTIASAEAGTSSGIFLTNELQGKGITNRKKRAFSQDCVQFSHAADYFIIHVYFSRVTLVSLVMKIPIFTQLEQVMLDFQSKILQQQWQQHQKQVLEKVTERLYKVQERKEKLQQEIQQWTKLNEKLQFELDSKIDEQTSKFSDLVHAVEYDTQRVEKKFIRPDTDDQKKKNPCLEQRVNLAACFKSNPKQNVVACDVYVNALDSCIEEIFVKKQ